MVLIGAVSTPPTQGFVPGKITSVEEAVADASSYQFHVKLDFDPDNHPDLYTLDLIIHQLGIDDSTVIERVVPRSEISGRETVLGGSLPLVVLLIERKDDTKYFDIYFFSRSGTPLNHGWQHYVTGKGKYDPEGYNYDKTVDISKLTVLCRPISGMIEGALQAAKETKTSLPFHKKIENHPTTQALRSGSLASKVEDAWCYTI
jgi:hypothetical protein